jgi:hypothetical protein
MSDVCNDDVNISTIDDCRRMDPMLRSGLETLDDEIRRIVARISAKTTNAGGDEALFMTASSTVLLSIVAAMTKAVDHRPGHIDVSAFLARANHAAIWANDRRIKFTAAEA